MVRCCRGGRASNWIAIDPALAQKARPLSSVTFDFVLSDFSWQCVPVNVEYLLCLALVATAPGKRGLKELLLKFLQGFVETNFLLQHFSHESIQYFFHTTPLRSAQPQRFCSNGSGFKSGAASRTDGALGDGVVSKRDKHSVVGAMFRRSRQSTGLSGE